MSKKILRVQSVIFDMDGVITNTMPDHFHAWKVILERHGIHVTHHDIYKREGQQGFVSVFEIFAQYGKAVDSKKAKKILFDKEILLKQIVKRRFIPGARSFIRRLNREGFKLALVTGTSRHELHNILPDSLYKLFDVVVTGTDVKNGKPHPEPFIKAVKELQIHSREAIVIENAPFGIESAKTANLKCIAISTSLPKPFLTQADHIVESFLDLNNKMEFKLLGRQHEN